MSATPEKQKAKWIATRSDSLGRWEIIRECRVPDYFTEPGSGKRIQVGKSIVKAVLLDIAEWDRPEGADLFRSNGNIAHATGLSLRSVNKAVAVLTEAKILTKRFRGVMKSKGCFLDWDLIESLREKYQPRPGEIVPSASDVVVEQTSRPEDLDSFTGELVDLIMAFEQLSVKVSRRSAETVIAGLLRKHDSEIVQTAIEGLDKMQLAAIVRADNSPAYLRTVLRNTIDGMTTDDQSGEGGTGKEPSEEYSEEDEMSADYFAWAYNNNLRGLAFDHLIPVFQSVIDPVDREHLMSYIQDAFKVDPYYRKIPLEESARTFVKQLARWRAKLQSEFPSFFNRGRSS
jgi:hypothetical protein